MVSLVHAAAPWGESALTHTPHRIAVVVELLVNKAQFRISFFLLLSRINLIRAQIRFRRRLLLRHNQNFLSFYSFVISMRKILLGLLDFLHLLILLRDLRLYQVHLRSEVSCLLHRWLLGRSWSWGFLLGVGRDQTSLGSDLRAESRVKVVGVDSVAVLQGLSWLAANLDG